MKTFLLIATMLVASAVTAHAQDVQQAPTFAEQVDLTPLGLVAVHNEGRLKSYGSHANALMGVVSGPRKIAGQTPQYTYLDMLFRPEAYQDADCIYVKNKLVRNEIAAAVVDADPEMADRMEAFTSSGLLAPQFLDRPEVAAVMGPMEADLIRTAKQVDAIRSARFVMSPSFLLDRLRIVPPGGDDPNAAWHGIQEIMLLDGEGIDPAVLATMPPQAPIEGLDAATQGKIAASWRRLVNGWGRQDPAEVNAAVEELSMRRCGR